MSGTSHAAVDAELSRAIDKLAAAGCPDPRSDAEQLIAAALRLDRGERQEHGRNDLTPPVLDLLSGWFDRRAAREPVEYIVRRCQFRDLHLRIDHRARVPRTESGTLVEAALTLPEGARVHDVGTGCGAIALATKAERPDLVVTGSDIAPDAIGLARENAVRLHLDVRFAVASGLPDGTYDLVVANLPYQDSHTSAVPSVPEDDHQPSVSQLGGCDGLEVIRDFLVKVSPGVMVALKHAPSQAEAISALLRDPRPIGPSSGPARFTLGQTPE
ncbi:N5-glutamine methyltransferase family protein [Streptomyces ureilyticus]|uniref:Methyltransferase n=1 Tax=Streptomyces ureilyticus TaxID=1775131 RepID=A0ABX0DMA6_9ACTN|nr:methyltransferase [Streptomyces ureilyticus]NGO41438.1 methyltransferase [Streptomyces ureilyticus]